MGMDASTMAVIQADNGWLRGRKLDEWFAGHLPERYLARGAKLDPKAGVSVVVGPRQAGKSTLIWKTLSSMAHPVLFLDCEEPSVRDWLRSPALFHEEVDRVAPRAKAIFLEEVQHLPEAGLFLKGLADRRSRRWVVATGSSSFDLGSKTRETLAGRAERRLVLPLSLAEASEAEGQPDLLRASRLHEAVESHAVYGGYPRVVCSPNREETLSRLVETFVLRDASDRFRIRHVSAFRRLLVLLAAQAGNLLNASEYASLLGVSNDTVADYLTILEDCHVVAMLRPFVGGKRAELTHMPKVYFLDNGVRNLLLGMFQPLWDRPDRGALMENLVFSELAKVLHPLLTSIHYWRSKSGAEVDFVVRRGEHTLAVEVKSGGARPHLSRSMRSFIEAYAPDRFLIAVPGAAPPEHAPEELAEVVRIGDLAAAVAAWERAAAGMRS